MSSASHVVLPSNMAVAENISAAVDHVSEMKFVSRSLFYLVSPNETSFQKIEEVPNYFIRAMAYMPLMMLVECVFLIINGRKLPTYGDAMCSLCCSLLIFLPVAVVGQMEISLYMWCYDNFHLVDLSWDSTFGWCMCVLAVDLISYLWHRIAHEVNFFWAFHQVHHTSQEYNLTIGLRLPAFNRYVAMLFYLPCALFFPPSIFYAHYQLNYIFQLWIHSDVFPTFGVLDYVINNPSLHRVHHGRNRYCIDKNYGAVFSFWDLIFGTFEKEKPNEEIFFGLVHSINSFDPIYIQFHHLKSIYTNFFRYDGIGNKLSTLIKGPGWEPGKPRLGNVEEIPEVPEDKTLYDVVLPFWVKIYLLVHYGVAFTLFFRIKITKMLLSTTMVWLHAGYVLWAMVSQGMFLERRSSTLIFESVRCAAYFVLESLLQASLGADPFFAYTMRFIFFVSFLVCAANTNLFRPDVGGEKTAAADNGKKKAN